jgi:hypothetical protein
MVKEGARKEGIQQNRILWESLLLLPETVLWFVVHGSEFSSRTSLRNCVGDFPQKNGVLLQAQTRGIHEVRGFAVPFGRKCPSTYFG